MKGLFAVAVCVVVAGCVSAPQKVAERRQQQDREDAAYCASLGAKPGSDSYINCMVSMKATHRQQEMNDEATAAAYNRHVQRMLLY